jgi:hypothetical protein
VHVDWKSVMASGFAAVRRNVLPGLALQVFALALVLTYYLSPDARPTFELVASWKLRFGLGYSALATALFGGLIPYLYLLGSGQVPPGQRRAQLLFYVLFWAYRGVEVDVFYRLQAFLFGDQASLSVVLPKVLVDQLIYSIVIAAPGQVVFFLWKERGFSLTATRPDLNLSYLVSAEARVVFSQWMVWIPAVSIIYSLPSALQIPLFNLVVCFWVLLLTFVSKHGGQHASQSVTAASG